MEIGTIVYNKQTSEIGVSVWDPFGRGGPNDETIVIDGTDSCESIDRDKLRVIGKYESDVADIDKCTANKGEKVCKYLGKTASGPECLRFSKKRNAVIFSNKHKGKVTPKSLYPKCQDEIE